MNIEPPNLNIPLERKEHWGLVLVAACAVAVAVSALVSATFAKVFAAARTELPALTKLLLGMSRLMLGGWPYGLALTATSKRSPDFHVSAIRCSVIYSFNCPSTRSAVRRSAISRSAVRLPLRKKF